jgi:aldehyde dehydrogenase (NAD+)
MLGLIADRALAETDSPAPSEILVRRRPLGSIAVITPWNNPVYIPVGKLAPAIAYGNTVIWKPAPAGTAVAFEVLSALLEAGCPRGVAHLLCGDDSTARILMTDAHIDAVSLTGSSTAGYHAQLLSSRRRIPLQAELGGNNAAIVWSDANLELAAREVAQGAFVMAGQRCTANRRVVVESGVRDRFLSLLIGEVRSLSWGDPLAPETQVGPLVSQAQALRVVRCLESAGRSGLETLVPQRDLAVVLGLSGIETYVPPTIVVCDDPSHEIVQEETFGPILVVQRASSWEEAMKLCNGVRQGLAAALFSNSPSRQELFLEGARAGILKFNRSTADAEVDIPFGGWKESGIGPAEHGPSDREFFTRVQAVYRG